MKCCYLYAHRYMSRFTDIFDVVCFQTIVYIAIKLFIRCLIKTASKIHTQLLK